jgi:hypothetical protein
MLKMNCYLSKIVIVILSIFFISCDNEDKLRISSLEKLEEVKALAIEQFGGDFEIHKLTLYSEDDLTNNLGEIKISYFKEDKELYSRIYNVKTYGDEKNLEDEKMFEVITRYRSKYQKPEGHGKIKIKDLDFTRVMSDLNLGLNEYGDDIGSWSINNYTFHIEPKTNIVTTDFVLQITPAENATSLEGKRIVTNYYEMHIEIDSKGKLIVKDY